MAVSPKKQLKGSIIVVVLIIMMVSSFLVLVTMRYFVHMLSGFSTLTNYYKAYYMARWSMDVLLTQQSHRGWGYQVKNKNFSWSLQCLNCDLTWNIISRFPRIDTSIQPTDGACSADTAIVVSGWQSVIFPLFADTDQWPFTFQKSDNSFSVLASNLWWVSMKVYSNDWMPWGKLYLYNAKDWAYGAIKEWPLLLEQILNNSVPIGSEMKEYFANNLFTNTIQANYFLIVSNPQNEDEETRAPFSVCFTMGDSSTKPVPMIWLNTILRADARVADSYVTLETIKTNRFPSFLVQ